MKIYLTAIIQSKPEYTDEVLALLKNMVSHSRKEAGCLQYDLHRDNADENTFVFYEIWESEAILEQHNTQPYITAFIAAADKLVRAPVVYRMSLL
jgi:quinol monooxygenase YgiN